jgi:hypothetical protein
MRIFSLLTTCGGCHEAVRLELVLSAMVKLRGAEGLSSSNSNKIVAIIFQINVFKIEHVVDLSDTEQVTISTAYYKKYCVQSTIE